MRGQSDVIYTWTDEAPMLATHSLLPIVEGFTRAAGVSLSTADISLAGRILAAFGLAEDDLAALGALTSSPRATIIKLPNISASLPQLKAAIAELRARGHELPDYPDSPSSDAEREVRARYDAVKGSAVNPVLRSVVLMLRSGEANYESLPTLNELSKLVTSSQQTGLKVNYDRIGELPPLTPAIELTLYRVAQEALTNAAKHAGPSARVEVRLRGRSKTVELEVADDGIGMRTGLPGTGTGLIGMRERVTAVGGTLETGSKPRGGFRVRAEVPAEVSA